MWVCAMALLTGWGRSWQATLVWVTVLKPIALLMGVAGSEVDSHLAISEALGPESLSDCARQRTALK